jgi:hypothetical protein
MMLGCRPWDAAVGHGSFCDATPNTGKVSRSTAEMGRIMPGGGYSATKTPFLTLVMLQYFGERMIAPVFFGSPR